MTAPSIDTSSPAPSASSAPKKTPETITTRQPPSSPSFAGALSRPSPLLESSQTFMHLDAAVPPGMDAASFVAGERAAFARAFAAALPSQQALGQLFQAVDTLHSRLEEDAATVKGLQADCAAASASTKCTASRVQAMEEMALPALQRRCDDLAARPNTSPEVTAALSHLNGVLKELSAAQQAFVEASMGYDGPAGFLVRQLQTLVAASAAYGAAFISKADVAAVFLSRKVLVGDVAAQQWRAGRKARAVGGAALFVGAVEAAWQAHERLIASRLPLALRPANAPLRTGLRTVRGVVWAAAFVLAASEARTACASVVTKFLRRGGDDDAEQQAAGEENGAPPV